MAVRLMLAPTCLQAGFQPFDIVFVDHADLRPIVLVPLSKLFSHLGYGAAIESDGLDLGHVVLPSLNLGNFGGASSSARRQRLKPAQLQARRLGQDIRLPGRKAVRPTADP
jgi:hypothetical protein